MSATMTTVQALLKEMYEGQVNNQLNEEQVTAKRIEQTAEGVEDNIGGQHTVFPVRKSRNKGISYRPESAQLGGPGRQGYERAIENLKYGYGEGEVTGPLMALAETKPQSFMSAMDGEMDGLRQDLLKDQNRICVGNRASIGYQTGILAVITDVTGAPTYVVDNPVAVTVGSDVDVINPATSAVRGTQNVTDVDLQTGAVTLDGSVTGAANGDFVVRTGNYGEEPYGVLSILGDSGTVHQIDSDAPGNGYWKSVVDSTTTTLTEQAMISMCDTIRQSTGGKPSAVFCSLGVRRAYFNIMLSLRRYAEPKEFPGGLVGLTFNHGKEIPLVEDPDFPNKTMALIQETEFKNFRKRDWYFEDSDGAILKWLPGYDKFTFYMKKYWQMGTHKRGAHGLFTNLDEPTA